MRDLIDAMRAELEEIRDTAIFPLSPTNNSTYVLGWQYAQQKSVPFNAGNVESVNYFSLQVHAMHARLCWRSGNPLGLSRVENQP